MQVPLHRDRLSAYLRTLLIDPATKSVRLAILEGSPQEPDLSRPTNCGGLGRIHKFRRSQSPEWPHDPLPILPAVKRLGIADRTQIDAQVFQLAGCDLRCWYCFVPYSMLTPRDSNSRLISVEKLIGIYQAEKDPPKIIDCSGGQPDLAPEWIPWMMQELEREGLHDKTFLWSDDNLTNDLLWSEVPISELDRMQSYKNYARVGCIKGFNGRSYSFNTKDQEDGFELQLNNLRRLLTLDIDQYVYVTLTGLPEIDLLGEMRHFVDKLQQIDQNLPLRTVPLEIMNFGVTKMRTKDRDVTSPYSVQYEAVHLWRKELETRYSQHELNIDIDSVELKTR